ncbi:MAG: glutaminyl-peptide cyclotransferase [Candidatus Bathyarchaeota archaeon]|nr:glutaminyl-peptide cyclotransferase [Candidatus Termiticorpusculum sp.]
MKKIYIAVTAIVCLAIIICMATIISTYWSHTNNYVKTPVGDIPVYSYTIIQMYPHNSSAFTQGLTFDDNGNLIEGTGINGASSLRRVNLVDGKILQQINLDKKYFGEGIAVVDNRIVQLTWQNKIGFIYDKETFELLDEFNLSTEGWGLTYDGSHLVVSDGTANLYFLDTNNYQIIDSISVYDAEGSVENLNELEYINGVIYANIWHSSKIAIINPVSGQVEAYIDLDKIAQPYIAENAEAVLNGIAYNTQTMQLYVTGKNWSNIYEITINEI